jgi:predicted ABC-type ATPase
MFEEAVEILKANRVACGDHCVSVSPVDARYDLSMALLVDGFTFEAFEAIVYNLVGCAEAIGGEFPEQRTIVNARGQGSGVRFTTRIETQS